MEGGKVLGESNGMGWGKMDQGERDGVMLGITALVLSFMKRRREGAVRFTRVMEAASAKRSGVR